MMSMSSLLTVIRRSFYGRTRGETTRSFIILGLSLILLWFIILHMSGIYVYQSSTRYDGTAEYDGRTFIRTASQELLQMRTLQNANYSASNHIHLTERQILDHKMTSLKKYTSPLSPGLTYCASNPFLSHFQTATDYKQIIELEQYYIDWFYDFFQKYRAAQRKVTLITFDVLFLVILLLLIGSLSQCVMLHRGIYLFLTFFLVFFFFAFAFLLFRIIMIVVIVINGIYMLQWNVYFHVNLQKQKMILVPIQIIMKLKMGVNGYVILIHCVLVKLLPLLLELLHQQKQHHHLLHVMVKVLLIILHVLYLVLVLIINLHLKHICLHIQHVIFIHLIVHLVHHLYLYPVKHLYQNV